ncbi:MAG TPA: hypothetical protein VGR73_22745 [Bryobacteraceae bacterium]|nr:hypothetical protein [Bryobacteraceae bacterium]
MQAAFASFEAHECEYVVIGGIAAVLHGVPRATFDLDIRIAATLENGRRVLEAGMGTATFVTPEELLAYEITVFQDRIRIDVQTSTPGLTFAEAWEHKVGMEYHAAVLQSQWSEGRRQSSENNDRSAPK